MLRRCALFSLTALAGLAATAPGASATTSTVRVGIADQSASMFGSSAYKALDLKRTRSSSSGTRSSTPRCWRRPTRSSTPRAPTTSTC